MKKQNTRSLIAAKRLGEKKLHMLTCYDYQTACMLNETELDMILVGDSLGNVVLGHETTVEVTIEEMRIFSGAVKRGAPDKFVVADLPFGSYSTFETAIQNSIKLFQSSKVEALKLEGASEDNCRIIKRLVETGIPIMGHIGLMPQSVHAQGGYYKHGKEEHDKARILKEALRLQEAGCFAIVLECVEETLSLEITNALTIPTIGIGSGSDTDGQVLVINDLLGMAKKAPSFVKPMINLFETKKAIISQYLN